ncbi:hypothetical protein HD554DRAFT_927993 [Boletus coccyginus]|nr:hypothetical protein HD554DRAFT_927993 [Boletus coccyginus]
MHHCFLIGLSSGRNCLACPTEWQVPSRATNLAFLTKPRKKKKKKATRHVKKKEGGRGMGLVGRTIPSRPTTPPLSPPFSEFFFFFLILFWDGDGGTDPPPSRSNFGSLSTFWSYLPQNSYSALSVLFSFLFSLVLSFVSSPLCVCRVRIGSLCKRGPHCRRINENGKIALRVQDFRSRSRATCTEGVVQIAAPVVNPFFFFWGVNASKWGTTT